MTTSSSLRDRIGNVTSRVNAKDDRSGRAPAGGWPASFAAELAGDFDGALNALATQRDNYATSFRRGWLLYRAGRLQESVTAYQRAAAMQPAGIEARLGMQLPLMALGQWVELATESLAVLELDPENYLAVQRLAYANFSTQRYAEAATLYRRLLQLYPSDVEVRSSLGYSVLRAGSSTEAAELFGQVLEVDPKHWAATAGYREASTPPQSHPDTGLRRR